nr:hypothetical protein [Tanacetum cinerariifolium]
MSVKIPVLNIRIKGLFADTEIERYDAERLESLQSNIYSYPIVAHSNVKNMYDPNLPLLEIITVFFRICIFEPSAALPPMSAQQDHCGKKLCWILSIQPKYRDTSPLPRVTNHLFRFILLLLLEMQAVKDTRTNNGGPDLDKEETTTTRTSCIPRLLKASLTLHPKSEAMRSPMSDGPRISYASVPSSRIVSPCLSNVSNKRMPSPRNTPVNWSP